jgi:hypothetical protein
MCKDCMNGEGNLATRYFREECNARGLDPESPPDGVMPPLVLLQSVIQLFGGPLIDNPDFLLYFAAELVAFGRVTDEYARKSADVLAEELDVDKLAERIFREHGGER